MTSPGHWIWKLFGVDYSSTDGKIKPEWDFLPDLWVFVFGIVLLAALVFFVYRSERKDVGLGRKIFLTAVRALLLLVVAFMLFGPKLTLYTIEPHLSYVLVLVDESSSMNKSDPPLTRQDQLRLAKATGISDDDVLDPGEVDEVKKLTRAEIVRRVLDNKKIHLLEDLEAKLNVKYYTFSGRPAEQADRGFLKNYRPDGKETAIGEAMRLALQKEHSVVAMIVISDFRNNVGVDPEEISRQFHQRYIPLVYTVLPGIPHKPRNIALLEPEAPAEIVFNDEYTLAFKVGSNGFEGQEVSVGLWVLPRKKGDKAAPTDPDAIEALLRDAKKELDHPVRLLGNGEKQQENVQYYPKEPGEYLLILKVEPKEGESTKHDNYLIQTLRVHDKKFKVLYVEHPPRYEYRFLKNALIRDTNVLCHVLLTSADPDVEQPHTKGSNDPMFQGPIKEFPKTREELFKYDVLILGDIDPARIGGEEVWGNIEAFVSEFGGGLILLSGYDNPRLFLEKPPLKKLIPVELDDSHGEGPDTLYDRDYGYRLTAEAKGLEEKKPHPIVGYRSFGGAPERNIEHWEDRDGRGDGQVGIRKFVRTRGLAPQASTLVEVIGTQGDLKPPPLFVVQYNGIGRVFWSGTDETWRWRYLVGDSPWFYPFWQQTMEWVRRGKLLGAKRYRIRIDKERYNLNEKVQVYANAYDERFNKLTKDKLTVYVEPPEGKREPVVLGKSADGYYVGEYGPKLEGNYRIWAGEEDESTRAEDRFRVTLPMLEDEDPTLNEGLFERVAKASQSPKGKPQSYRIDRLDELAGDIKAREEIQRRAHPPKYLWSSPIVWILFTLLITLEWILRKVWRML